MNTKKAIAILSLVAMVITISPSLASANGGNEGKGNAIGRFFGGIFKRFEHKLPATNFVISGTVVSTSTNSLVANVQVSANIPSLVNSQATVVTDANTKFFGKDKKTIVTLASMVSGDRVEITGTVSGSVLTATAIYDLGKAPVQPVTLNGKVTAVSATSITLSNAIASTSQVFTIDSNTKVTIDGVTKAVADIQVGDAGTIKSKNSGTTFTATMINLYR